MKNKKLVWIIPLVIIVIIIIVAGALGVLYFTTDIFKTNEELFAKYLLQDSNLQTLLKAENTETQKQFKENNSYISSGKLVIVTENENGESKEVNIDTNSRYDKEKGRSFSEMALKKGDEDVLKMSYINSNDTYSIKCDSVLSKYVGIRNNNLKEFAKTMEVDEAIVEQLPDIISFEQINNSQLINENQSKYLIDTYLKVIVESIGKEKYSKTGKKTIGISGKEYQANGYVLTLNIEDVKSILINVLTKAKDDETTLNIIKNILTSLGVQENQMEGLDIKEQLQKMIQTIQNNKTKEGKVEFTVYEVEGKTKELVINFNENVKVTFDIVENGENYKKAVATIELENNEAMSSTTNKLENNAESIIVRIDMEKSTSISGEVTNNTEIYIQTGEVYSTMKMNTTLGNVVNNKAHNSSQIEIQDYNGGRTNISYEKTMQVANVEVQIEELTNENLIVLNNYSKEQLDPFLAGLGNKYGEVLGNAIGSLDLKLEQGTNSLQYIKAIPTSILAVANANGLEPVTGTGLLLGTTVLELGVDLYVQGLQSVMIDNTNM